MMTLSRFHPSRKICAFWAAAFLAPLLGAQPAPDSAAGQQARIQITEVGLLNTLVLVEEGSADLRQKITAELIKRDFSVFEHPEFVSSNITTQQMSAAGEAAGADLVIYAGVTDQQIDNYGGTVRFSAKASVKVINRVNNRTLAWNDPEEIKGERSSKPDRARTSARTKAIDSAVKGAVEQVLAGAHKMVVHRAVIVDVFTEADLLAKMEAIGRMKDVYHVKRLDFDFKTHEARIEIIGSPKSETVWRAYIEENMPKTKLMGFGPNADLRDKMPSWFNQ